MRHEGGSADGGISPLGNFGCDLAARFFDRHTTRLPHTPLRTVSAAVTERSFTQSALAVLGICFVVMMVAIDQTVVGTALPTIVAELRGFDLFAWVGTSYLLMSVITVPIFGRLGDFYGRKPLVLSAIGVFTAASVLCAFANSMLFLVLARALQGIGGGMLIGTAFACIPDLFPEPRVRLRWQIMLSSAFGIANALGPSLGGYLTQEYGWRSIFYVNLPVGLVGFIVVSVFLPRIRHAVDSAFRIDWQGAVLITIALCSLQFLVEKAPAHPLSWTTAEFLLLLFAASGTLLWWEGRCSSPLLPLAMFRDPRLAPLFALAALVGFAMFTILFYAPLLLQGGFGLTPGEAGLLITPLVVCITVGSIINGRLVTRVRVPNVMLYVGFGLLLLSFAGIVTLHRTTPHGLVALFMLLAGTGLGFIMPNLTVFAQEVAGPKQLGISTALVQSMRMIGGMIGTALVGAVVTHVYLHQVEQALADADAQRWLPDLDDPQILVNADEQQAFLLKANAAGTAGAPLVEAARTALVSAVHFGQALGALAALIGLWRVRAVPRLARMNAPVAPPAQAGTPPRG